MIKLNLLPPEEKMLAEAQKIRRKAVKVAGYGFFAIMTFLIALGSIWASLRIQLNSTLSVYSSGQKSGEGKELTDYKKEVGEINDKIKASQELDDQIINYSKYLNGLIDLVPDGIRFTGLSFNGKDVRLEGHADSRDILLSLKNSLEKSAYFGGINSPLGNFLKQSDISFDFLFKIK